MARFCIYCGAELASGTAFCTQCGKPVHTNTPATPAQSQPEFSAPASMPAANIPATSEMPAAMPQAPATIPATTQAETPAAKQKSNAPLIAGVAALVVALGVGAFFGLRALGVLETGEDAQNAASASVEDARGSSSDSKADQGQASATSSDQSSSNAAHSVDASASSEASVPNLSGLSEADARTKIEEAGLEVGAISYEKNDGIAKGNVISQKPTAGTKTEAGTSVTFVVSEGKAQHRYELVSGSYTWNDARAAAEGRGGYLACITSADEWNQVLGVLPSSGISVVWVGASTGSSRDFTWISGEDFRYNNWANGEPNNDGGNEDKLCLLCANGVWGWYDVSNDVSPYYTADKMGFLIEYED